MKAILVSLCFAATLVSCGPRSPQDRLERANEKAMAGDIPGAIADVQKVMETNLDEQTWAEAAMFLGSLHVRNRDIEAAKEQFQEVKKRFGVENPNPTFQQMGQAATLNIVQAYAQTGKREQAMKEVLETSATLKNTPEFSETLHLVKADLLAADKKPDEGAAMLHELAQKQSDPQITLQYLMRASGYYEMNGQAEEAAQVYLEYLESHPEFPLEMDLYILGGINLSMIPEPTEEQRDRLRGLMETALAKFEEGIRKPGPERERFLLGKATALRLLDRNTEAMDLLTSISQRQSFNPYVRGSALLDIGRYHQAEGQYEEARQVFQKLATDFPDFGESAAYALQMLSREQAERAISGAATQPTQPTTGPATQPVDAMYPTTAPAVAE